ncbi:MAG TPA: serine kinase [Pseudolabrys sp.]|nr:serine kinase [Pseudolabrys sp.]
MGDEATISEATIHAGAVLIGATALLILGPSGAGKSLLAWRLLQNGGAAAAFRFSRLVADDRALLTVHHGRLLVQPAPALAGLIELRGLGIRRLPYEPVAAVGRAVTLGVTDAPRLPEKAATIAFHGIKIPHMACRADVDPMPLLAGWLATIEGTD